MLNVYKGGVVPDHIQIVLFPRGFGSRSKSHFLAFLREVGEDGFYEPIRLDAGVLEVKNGRVPAWNCTFDQAVARIRAAR